jgi:hypothetical protein
MLDGRERFEDVMQESLPLLISSRATKAQLVTGDRIPVDEQQEPVLVLHAPAQLQTVESRSGGDDGLGNPECSHVLVFAGDRVC